MNTDKSKLEELQESTQTIFGQNLEKLILQHCQTRTKCAEDTRYSRSELSKLLYGQRNLTLQKALRFARHFNISLFLLFSRNFEIFEYRNKFPFVDKDYTSVIRQNFKDLNGKQSKVDLDPSTCSKLINGHRSNPTIKTLCRLALGANTSPAELLKTDEDKRIEKNLKEATE